MPGASITSLHFEIKLFRLRQPGNAVGDLSQIRVKCKALTLEINQETVGRFKGSKDNFAGQIKGSKV